MNTLIDCRCIQSYFGRHAGDFVVGRQRISHVFAASLFIAARAEYGHEYVDLSKRRYSIVEMGTA